MMRRNSLLHCITSFTIVIFIVPFSSEVVLLNILADIVWAFQKTHNDEILPFTEKEVVADEIADMSLNEKV